MEHYLFQSIFFQLLFLLVYELLLKKETFFSYNRGYLLLTPVLSLLLPLLKIESLSSIVPAETLVLLPEVFIGDAVGTFGTTANLSPVEVSSLNLWMIIYVVGASVSLSLFLRKYWLLKRLFRNRTIANEKSFRIIEVADSNVAFTFLRTVFLGDQISANERSQILSHEMVHVSQKHSVDLLFFEIFKILFWFNPLIYIYQSRISTLHEFIADARVVKSIEKKTYYQQLLNTAFNTQNISFINQFFNHSLIKKRIVMLQKSRSKSVAKFKYLLLVPLMLSMLVYVSCSQDSGNSTTDPVESSEVLEVEVKDFHNQTAAEKSEVKTAFDKFNDNTEIDEVVITDKISRISYKRKEGTDGPIITKTEVVEVPGTEKDNNVGDVPFSLIEDVPVFPGCEELASNAERKECMSEKITAHVNKNFDTSLGKELGLKGLNKIYVQFRITKSGSIELMGARGPVPELETEAERVVSSLPQMTPGKHKGENVDVIYSLPITFNAGE